MNNYNSILSFVSATSFVLKAYDTCSKLHYEDKNGMKKNLSRITHITVYRESAMIYNKN